MVGIEEKPQDRHDSSSTLEQGDSTPDDSVMSGENPLAVLRIASDIYPEVVGGLGLHVHEMSKLQASWGHDVTVLTSDHGDRSKPRRKQQDGYTVYFDREFLSPLNNSITPGLVRTFTDLVSEYDVVHAHSHLFFSTNLTALLSQLDDTPLVITNHGVVSQTAPVLLQRLFLPTVGRLTLQAADKVLCYTNTDRERLQEMGITTPILTIHNGVDCSLFEPQKKIGMSEKLLYVGRLMERKGVLELLTAFAQLREQFDTLTMKFVGDGPVREQLAEKSAELGVEDAVTFTGVVGNEKLPQLYSESRLSVVPSLNEGLPRTVLESLACETPVVSTDLPQLRSVVTEGGLTIPDNEPETIASACARLLENDSLRNHLGRRGRTLVESEYSWEDTVHKTTNVFYQLLESGERVEGEQK